MKHAVRAPLRAENPGHRHHHPAHLAMPVKHQPDDHK
jgi:hypothetical protein